VASLGERQLCGKPCREERDFTPQVGARPTLPGRREATEQFVLRLPRQPGQGEQPGCRRARTLSRCAGHACGAGDAEIVQSTRPLRRRVADCIGKLCPQHLVVVEIAEQSLDRLDLGENGHRPGLGAHQRLEQVTQAFGRDTYSMSCGFIL